MQTCTIRLKNALLFGSEEDGTLSALRLARVMRYRRTGLFPFALPRTRGQRAPRWVNLGYPGPEPALALCICIITQLPQIRRDFHVESSSLYDWLKPHANPYNEVKGFEG
jgi:hypothetical protein